MGRRFGNARREGTAVNGTGTHDLEALLSADPWPSAIHADALAPVLLENLASPDPDLRDRLSFSLLDRIVTGRHVSTAGMTALLTRAVDPQHLFAGLGRTDDDSVFVRSFSALVIALCLDRDRETGELNRSMVRTALDRVLRYAALERDFRGHVPGKGWAHAVAHGADALGALLCHPALESPADVEAILHAVRCFATVPYPLGYLEDDRLALAVFLGLGSTGQAAKVPDALWESFLDRFRPVDEEGGDPAEATLRRSNAVHFLRSLYFRLLDASDGSRMRPLREAIDRYDILRPDPRGDAPPTGQGS